MDLLPSYLKGPRLVLRLWVPEDAEQLTAAINESLPRLTPFMSWAGGEPLSVEKRRALIGSWGERWRRGEDAFLGMFHADMVVGGTGLHRTGAESDRVEIGYWVRSGHTGRGYATESARMLTTAAFDVADVETVAIHHDVANNASRRIPERLGFRRARVVTREIGAPGQTGSEVQWEIRREDWVS